MADALTEHFPSLFAAVGQLIDPEPGQVQSAQMVRIFERADHHQHFDLRQINTRASAAPLPIRNTLLFEDAHQSGNGDVVKMGKGGTTEQAGAAGIAAGGPQGLVAESICLAAPYGARKSFVFTRQSIEAPLRGQAGDHVPYAARRPRAQFGLSRVWPPGSRIL